MLQLRCEGRDVVLKAGAPGDHHMDREIWWAYSTVVEALAASGLAPSIVYADRGLRLLATTYLPGVLVEGTPAEHEPATYRQAGRALALLARPVPPRPLAPTHGDWQPRNWIVDNGRLAVINFGRADGRPVATDLARLAAQEFHGRPDLEQAFLEGYGDDPRTAQSWRRDRVREAIGTAVWAAWS